MSTPEDSVDFQIDGLQSGKANLCALINHQNAVEGQDTDYVEDNFDVVMISEVQSPEGNTLAWIKARTPFTGVQKTSYWRLPLNETVVPHFTGPITQDTGESDEALFQRICASANLCEDQLSFEWAEESLPGDPQRELIITPKAGVQNVLYKPGTHLSVIVVRQVD